MARIDPNKLTLEERVVQINRVAKVVQGGRRFSFSAVVVVGDGNGTVGAGLGKAGEVPEAIRKGVEDAKKRLIKVPLVGSTIPHEVHRHFGGDRLVGAHAHEVDVQHRALHRVPLDLPSQRELIGALDLQRDDGVRSAGAAEDVLELTRGHSHGQRVSPEAVHHGGDATLPAQAAGRPRDEASQGIPSH